MAITRMGHMKEGKQNLSSHLKNSIDYILDVKNAGEKTNHGLLVGGNAGVDAGEIYKTMMTTKEDFGKLDGRQGYHYVISFSPDEKVDEGKAYDVLKDFCEKYLDEGYDYVFAVHNDQEHMHGHIVFNSVGRVSGYKYRYQKGDWEKHIQPITDEICKKHGLRELTYEDKRVGKSYAEHAANKGGKSNGKKIIQGDIDYAISKTNSYEEFLRVMQSFGYKIKQGMRKQNIPYLTFLMPGSKNGRRDYNLGNGYSVSDIQRRILAKDKRYVYPKVPRIKKKRMKNFMKTSDTLTRFQVCRVRKLHQANWYRSLHPYKVNQSQVRKNVLRIEKIREECRYIFKHKIHNADELAQRKRELLIQERLLKGERNTIYANTVGEDERLVKEYKYIEKKLGNFAEHESDDTFEFLQDRMEELEERLPEALLSMERDKCSMREEIASVRKELQIMNRLLREEKELKITKLSTSKQKEKTYGRTNQERSKQRRSK
jgi:Relaxase/Mobilisation nuclease domain.